MDQEDESLKRYKEQLLGKALSGEGLDVKDPRKVIVSKFYITFPKGEHKPMSFELDTQEKVDKFNQGTVVIKEGLLYQFECDFKIYHEIVSALKFENAVYRSGVRLEKKHI